MKKLILGLEIIVIVIALVLGAYISEALNITWLFAFYFWYVLLNIFMFAGYLIILGIKDLFE